MSNFEGAWRNLADYEKEGDDFPVDDLMGNSHSQHNEIRERIGSERTRKNIQSLLEIEGSLKKDEIMKELFQDFLKSLLRYVGTIDNLSLSRMDSESSPVMLGEADKNRRIAHEAWISCANSLSRYFVKCGIDNSWRNVLGSTRNEQTEWALSVAETVRELALKGGE
jgi:hypothetical protein